MNFQSDSEFFTNPLYFIRAKQLKKMKKISILIYFLHFVQSAPTQANSDFNWKNVILFYFSKIGSFSQCEGSRSLSPKSENIHFGIGRIFDTFFFDLIEFDILNLDDLLIIYLYF